MSRVKRFTVILPNEVEFKIIVETIAVIAWYVLNVMEMLKWLLLVLVQVMQTSDCESERRKMAADGERMCQSHLLTRRRSITPRIQIHQSPVGGRRLWFINLHVATEEGRNSPTRGHAMTTDATNQSTTADYWSKQRRQRGFGDILHSQDQRLSCLHVTNCPA